MKKLNNILAGIIFILFAGQTASYAFYKITENSADVEEGIFQLKYSRVVNRPIPAIIFKDKLYMPFTEILSYLKIYYHYDSEQNYIKGFYIHPDSVFSIDIDKKIARYNSRKIYLEEEDVLLSDFDLYVKSSFFEDLFGLNIFSSTSQLLIIVNETVELPVLTQYKNRLKYMQLGTSESQKYFDLKFGRQRSLLNGAMLDYNLNATTYRGNMSYSYNGAYGMEILGGDFQVNSYGFLSQNTGYHYMNNEFRWRYYFGDNDLVSQIAVGNLSNLNYRVTSLPNQMIRGVQISNEWTKTPDIFSDFDIIDKTDPGAQVELWVNDQLIQQTTTDPEGYYQFKYPMQYGMTNVNIRIYSPNGDYKEKRDLIQIPSEFVQPGEIKYSLTAGEKIITKEKIAEGRFYYGITDWLTNSVSIGRSLNDKNISYYNSLKARMTESVMGTIDISDKLYKADLKAWLGHYGNYGASYTLFNGISDLNQTGLLNRQDIFVSLPRIFNIPININCYANRTENRYYDYYNAAANLNMNLFPLILQAGYRNSGSIFKTGEIYTGQFLSLNLYYNWFVKPGFLKFLNNTRLSGGIDYDLKTSKIDAVSLGIDLKLMNNALLRINGNRDFLRQFTSANVALKIDFSNFRSESNARTVNQEPFVFSQMIQGSLGFDPENMKVFFGNPTQLNTVGFGATNVRFFVDENLNGSYETGEEVLRGVKFDIPNANIDRGGSNEFRNAYNLIPYSRYNVVVDQASFRNPLLMPETSKFSFVADPNTFKSLDIPCFAGGVIEGNVIDIDTEKPLGVGLKVHVVSSDSSFDETIPIFRDGTFYKMGIPPGRYDLYIDQKQLEALNLECDPPSIQFHIDRTKDGDYKDGFDFKITHKAKPVAAKEKSRSMSLNK